MPRRAARYFIFALQLSWVSCFMTPKKHHGLYRKFQLEASGTKDQLIELCEKCPNNGVGASDEAVQEIEAAIVELEPSCGPAPAKEPLTGTYDLLFCTAPGGSNGKVGPFVGKVTQEFVDEKKFINAVSLAGGAIKISLFAEREVLGDDRIRVTFKDTGIQIFGNEIFRKSISGSGVWQQRYVDSDLRVMNTPSIFILRKRPPGDGNTRGSRGGGYNSAVEENATLKAAWQATEFLGKFSRIMQSRHNQEEKSVGKVPANLQEASQRLQADFDRDYFISGAVDAQLYDEHCLFADPFASFRGRSRFISNLKNLGSFIKRYELRLLEYDESRLKESPPIVRTKTKVTLLLNLPWKPVLSWPWSVEYEFDAQSYQVVAHRESWDVSATEGVLQCFRPGSAAVLERLRKRGIQRGA